MTDPSSRAPSFVILGTDAVLAARPATPVQLAHACLAIGFDGVVPASWGDELVADAAMDRIAREHDGPVVLCACANVERRVLQVGPELQPFLVSLVAPPVAVARYLRALWEPQPIRLTFVGRCASASDEVIDARLSPLELLTMIEERGIRLAEQPQVFDEVIPPDRRRHHSVPGGAPFAERLRERCGRELAQLNGRDLTTELAQHLLSGSDVVLDVAASLGCACTGASECATPREARAAVEAIEPPRSATPVLVPLGRRLPLDRPLPAPAREHAEPPTAATPPSLPAPTAAPPADEQAAAPPADVAVRLRTPTRGDEPPRPTPPSVPPVRMPRADAGGRPFVVRRRPGDRPRRAGIAILDRRRGIAGAPPPPPLALPVEPGQPAALSNPVSPVEALEPVERVEYVEPAVPPVADAPPPATRAESPEIPEISEIPTGDADGATPAADRAPIEPPDTWLARDAAVAPLGLEEPQDRESEMDRLRRTAERALAPFIASVRAMDELGVDPMRPRPELSRAPAPRPVEPVRTDVAAEIVVAREPAPPQRADAAPPVEESNEDAEEPTAVVDGTTHEPLVAAPTLKSVAARATAARPMDTRALMVITPVEETPVAPSRSLAVAAGVAIGALVLALAALQLGLAGRVLSALGVALP